MTSVQKTTETQKRQKGTNIIGNGINIQYSSYNNIEFIHEILNDIFLNHRNEILTYIQIINNQFNKMFKEASFKNSNLDISKYIVKSYQN